MSPTDAQSSLLPTGVPLFAQALGEYSGISSRLGLASSVNSTLSRIEGMLRRVDQRMWPGIRLVVIVLGFLGRSRRG